MLFKELVYQAENGGGAFWSCKSCRSATSKLNKKITEIYKKVEELESETKDNKIEIQSVKDNLADTNKRIDKLSETSHDKESASQDAVFRELKDREERRNNLIIHNLAEPGPEVRLGKDRKEADIKNLTRILDTINVKLNWDTDIKFVRRIGEKRETDRPLLVGVTDPSLCVTILKNASRLANTQFSSISLVPDLTRRQREEDDEVRKLCETRNSQRSGDDLNFTWKPLGPRGSRRPVKTRIQREQERITSISRPNWTNKQTNSHITGRQTDTWTENTPTNRQIRKQTNIQTQIDTLTDRQTDRQTDRDDLEFPNVGLRMVWLHSAPCPVMF